MSKVVTVEVEIPDDAILGPAMCITYAKPSDVQPDPPSPGMIRMELHASARFDKDKALKMHAPDPGDWMYAMHQAIGSVPRSGH